MCFMTPMPRRSTCGPAARCLAGSHRSKRCAGSTTWSSTLMILGSSAGIGHSSWGEVGRVEVVHPGGRWGRELFFLGHSLQLRDAEGHRLYLESWLWDASTRTAFVEAMDEGSHS